MTRNIKKLIVHCSYTPTNMDIGAEEIRHWHTKDNGWRDIGYHWVIRRDGTLEQGRPESQVGAHTLGENGDSIGICLVGGMRKSGRVTEPDCNFSAAQFFTLARLLADLKKRHPEAAVTGHRDHAAGRACPTFDAAAFAANLGV